ncbi:MAG: tRNA (N6-threonylcarbamoyladenosine(37)-N6)-methyltransferase TrmO [Alphaproteobacteria bacterium]|nr:tRNA (N6-threonylcarbamoyladenosine(37)-N6)-methyltransferase TrmO [Alphaproteobacteria bacterium]
MDEDDREYTDAVPFPDRLVIEPIGVVRSAYLQRHGTPRQPGMTSVRERDDSEGEVHLFPHRVPAEALQDLAGFSHAWIVSWFHLNGPRKRPLVRPPRGGPKRGVFATRAPHRPVPIGLSAVEVLGVEGHVLRVRGLDLLDGTPVLDLKPYIPDFDAIPDARRGWLEDC